MCEVPRVSAVPFRHKPVPVAAKEGGASSAGAAVRGGEKRTVEAIAKALAEDEQVAATFPLRMLVRALYGRDGRDTDARGRAHFDTRKSATEHSSMFVHLGT